jgi:hypothetical protein
MFCPSWIRLEVPCCSAAGLRRDMLCALQALSDELNELVEKMITTAFYYQERMRLTYELEFSWRWLDTCGVTRRLASCGVIVQ